MQGKQPNFRQKTPPFPAPCAAKFAFCALGSYNINMETKEAYASARAAAGGKMNGVMRCGKN